MLIASCLHLKTKKQVRRFLGLVYLLYHARFCVQLHRPNQPHPKGCSRFGAVSGSILAGKELLLYTPNFSLPGLGLGAALSQEIRGDWPPCSIHQQYLSEREARCSTVEKEWAVDSLRYYLLDRHFSLCSDHARLQHEGCQRLDHPVVSGSPAFCSRWSVVMADFLSHLQGVVSEEADQNSWWPLSNHAFPIWVGRQDLTGELCVVCRAQGRSWKAAQRCGIHCK